MEAVFIKPNIGKTQPIKVRDKTHNRLKEGAKSRGISMQNYADQLLENGMDIQDTMLAKMKHQSA